MQYRPTVENFNKRDHDIDGTTYSGHIPEVGSAAEKPSPSCFEDSAVLIFVYSTILRETFEHAQKLVNSLKATSGHAPIVLIRNKDQDEVRPIKSGHVSTTEGCRLPEDYRALFWEISAINTKNVQNFSTSLLSEVANVRRETNRMPGNYSASWMRMLDSPPRPPPPPPPPKLGHSTMSRVWHDGECRGRNTIRFVLYRREEVEKKRDRAGITYGPKMALWTVLTNCSPEHRCLAVSSTSPYRTVTRQILLVSSWPIPPIKIKFDNHHLS